MKRNFPIEYTTTDGTIYIPIEVNNFKIATEFYAKNFGYLVVFDGAEEMGWLELETHIKSVRIGLDLKENLSNNDKKVIMSITVKDMIKTKEFLEKNGVKVGSINNIPNMASLLNCWDPFGNCIQIISTPFHKLSNSVENL